jgi:hypothetical protein
MHVRQHHPRHGGRPRELRSRDCTYCDRDDGGQLHAPHHDDGGQLHALHSDRDDGGKPSRAPVPGLAVRFASLASLARLQCMRRPGSRSTLALPVRRGPRPHLPFPSRRHESRRSLVAPFHRSGAVGGRKRGSRPRARTRGGVGTLLRGRARADARAARLRSRSPPGGLAKGEAARFRPDDASTAGASTASDEERGPRERSSLVISEGASRLPVTASPGGPSGRGLRLRSARKRRERSRASLAVGARQMQSSGGHSRTQPPEAR